MGQGVGIVQQQVLGLINPAISLVFAILFFFLWRKAPARRHVGMFAAGYVCSAIGFLIFHFVPDPSARVSILSMHIAYATGCSILAIGAAQRVGQRLDPAFFIFIAVVSAILLIISTYGNDQNPRLYIANAAFGLVFMLGAYSLSLAPRRDAIDRVVFWLFVLSAFQFFVRPAAIFMMEDSITAADYRASIYYSAMVLIVAVISLLLALTLLAGSVIDQMKQQRDAASVDHLTGLYTRRAFEEGALELLAQARQRGQTASLIVADLDYFKQVNDLWGHQVGDNAIAAFGALIQSTIRDSDIAGRVGGEEFCIAVRNCPGAAAARLAERIRTALTEAAIDGVPDDIHLTASFGVAEFGGDESYGRLFGIADAALYEAKNRGRNCVHYGGVEEAEGEPVRRRRAFRGAQTIAAVA